MTTMEDASEDEVEQESEREGAGEPTRTPTSGQSPSDVVEIRNADPKQTRIYGRARELIVVCDEICRRLPRNQTTLRSQLQRASESVLLNFVEGCGRTSRTDRAQFFAIARGSAQECAAAVDIALARREIPEALAITGITAADHVAAMLSRWH